MEVDTDIEELKEQVEELKAMTADTNHQVHKMRRGIWWGRVWALVWWAVVFSISGAAYYYYLGPMVLKAQQYYAQFQHQAGQTQSWEQQAQHFFEQLMKASPGQAPTVPQSGQ